MFSEKERKQSTLHFFQAKKKVHFILFSHLFMAWTRTIFSVFITNYILGHDSGKINGHDKATTPHLKFIDHLNQLYCCFLIKPAYSCNSFGKN